MRLLLILTLVISCASQKEKVSTEQKKAEIYYNSGTNELVNRNFTHALKKLIEAYRLSPKDTRIANNLGMAYFFKKRPNTALKYIKKAIELDKTNTEAKLNLATVHMEMGNLEVAKKNFEVVLEDLTFDQQFRTYYNLGLLSMKRNSKRQALNFFKQSISENENYCPAHYKLGEIHFQKAHFETALEHFKNASKGVCYNNPEPIYQLAMTYLKLNQVAFAKDKLEDIIGRFQGTQYEKNAQRKLQVINLKLNQYEAKVLSGEDPNRQILSPDF